MATGTKAEASVTVERDARILRESLTRCRRDCSMPVVDSHVRNLQKRLDNQRIHSCEHIVTLTRDAFERRAPRQDVEAFFRAGIAMVASWYLEREQMPDLPTLIRLETEAEAIGDLREMNMALDPTPKNIADAAEALRSHLIALDQLVNACERCRFDGAVQASRQKVA